MNLTHSLVQVANFQSEVYYTYFYFQDASSKCSIFKFQNLISISSLDKFDYQKAYTSQDDKNYD